MPFGCNNNSRRVAHLPRAPLGDTPVRWNSVEQSSSEDAEMVRRGTQLDHQRGRQQRRQRRQRFQPLGPAAGRPRSRTRRTPLPG